MNRPFCLPVVVDDNRAETARVWSVERIVLLHLHYLQGISAAESAKLIGGVSRNAVISKRYRMGLFGGSDRTDPASSAWSTRSLAACDIAGLRRERS